MRFSFSESRYDCNDFSSGPTQPFRTTEPSGDRFRRIGATHKSPSAGDDAETLYVRMRWAQIQREEKVSAKVMAQRVGIGEGGFSMIVTGKNGVGRSVAGWAKALGYRSVGAFRVAAYRWYLANVDLGVAPESAVIRTADPANRPADGR